MHGEALAYPMALLSIIFTIKTIEEKSLILKNKYIFYSSIFMVVGILCRPNLWLQLS